MEIISHRAINSKYPENSLPAIKWAFDSGYGIETDIRINKDGTLVIIHDEDGKRLFNNSQKIIEMTDEECTHLIYKGYEKEKISLCTFKDVCNALMQSRNKKCVMALHIKDINESNVVEKTIQMIRKYNLQNQSFVFAVDSQTLPLIKDVKERYSDISVGLHLPENSKWFTENHFSSADIIWADEETGNWLSPKMVELAKKTNSLTYCMSPEFVPNNIFQNNYKKRWEDLLKLGFDAIVTDHADELREFIQKRN